MSITQQILYGSLVLSVCAIIHVAILVAAVELVRRFGERLVQWSAAMRGLAILGVAFASVVFAHTVQVWIWAFVVYGTGTLESFENAFYFVLVTSTTVGYGDLTLGADHRIFGAFAGVTGLLTFGVSTAILVSLFGKLVQEKD